MKLLTVAAIVTIGLFASLIGDCRAESKTWGTYYPYSPVLFQTTVYEQGKELDVVKRDVDYVNTSFNRNCKIRAVEVIDHAASNGGHATLAGGGPGERHANVHLESEPGKGLHCTVKFYGC